MDRLTWLLLALVLLLGGLYLHVHLAGDWLAFLVGSGLPSDVTESDYALYVTRDKRDAKFLPAPRRRAAMTASATRTIGISISRPRRKTRPPADAKKLIRPPKSPVLVDAAGFPASEAQAN